MMAPIISSPVYGVLAEADGRFPLTDISAEGGFRFYDVRHTRHTLSTPLGRHPLGHDGVRRPTAHPGPRNGVLAEFSQSPSGTSCLSSLSRL